MHPDSDGRRRPLHVCHVAYTFYETDNRVRRYVEALMERGDQVDVVALRRDGQARREERDGIRFFRVQRRDATERGPVAHLAKFLLFLIRAMMQVSLEYLRQPYDVLHVHNVPDFLVFAGWVPKCGGAGLLLDIHDIVPELYCDKFRTPKQSWVFHALTIVERLSVRFADHVIVAGELWRQRLISRANIQPERCTSMINYPDCAVFKPAQASERHRDGKFILLYPGTLNPHQGVDIAVRAFAMVKDQMPNAELHIYGSGPAKRDLTALLERLRLNGAVRLSAPVPVNQIARVMADADLGLIPKRAEGFGNEAFSTKSLEFMACGIPVVMARTQVDANFFDDSLVKFFEPGCAESLAKAILADYRSAEGRHARAERAACFAASMDWATKRADYLRIVDSVAHP